MRIKTKIHGVVVLSALLSIAMFVSSHISADKLAKQNDLLMLVADNIQDGVRQAYMYADGDTKALDSLKKQQSTLSQVKQTVASATFLPKEKVTELDSVIQKILSGIYDTSGIIKLMEEYGDYNTGLYKKSQDEVHALAKSVELMTKRNGKAGVSEISTLVTKIRERERAVMVYSNQRYNRSVESYLKDFSNLIQTAKAKILADTSFADEEKSDAIQNLESYEATFRKLLAVSEKTNIAKSELTSAADNLDQIIISMREDNQKDSELQENIKLAVLVIGLTILTLFGYLLTRSIMSRIKGINSFMKELSDGKGDLTHRLNESGNDEFVETSNLFNKFIAHLQKLVEDIKEHSKSLADYTGSISQGSSEMTTALSEQSDKTAGVAAAMEQIATSIAHVRQTVGDVKQHTDQTEHSLRSGEVSQKTAAKAIENLAEFSKRISNLTRTIETIAFQTNILALNAAVEAASAGDQGRGFAVVATEVRSLAKRAGDSALEIKQMATTMIEHIEQVSSTSKEVDEIIEKVFSIVRETAVSVNNIVSAIAEQDDAGKSISANIETIAAVTDRNSSAIQNVDGEIQKLKKVADELTMMVSEFKT